MSIFILPHSVTKEVEKLCRGFLWGWNGSRSKLHVASWEKVCLPKTYGGLGLEDGIKWNQAILAKYVWAISSKRDILWVKWVNNIYLKSKNWWDYELKSDTSWYWRKLCHLRDKFSCEDIIKARTGTKFKAALLYNSSILQSPFEYIKFIWCSINMPKHRFIFWQAINSQLLSRDKFEHFHIKLDNVLCPVCEAAPESNAHLFFDCWFSQQVVEKVCGWLGIKLWPTGFHSWKQWLVLNDRDKKHRVHVSTMAAMIYFIWSNRNNCLFNKFSSTASKITQDIKETLYHRLHVAKGRNLKDHEK
ncbi:uncharacterized protein LOC115719925 [Cannabis sativa]|uniref:uncharacterized protein LOC115719925 n=1 Tax=Cannabis sativa TaxID=3483 RepID=UPI0029CA708D|nr:uncharacterized protein LOC115719925 [Cannabis sativa]